jgi:hypothetical protein
MQSPNKHARDRARCGVPVIVHSHLRWDFVWQRPQQLLSRMATCAPVLFLEEPVFPDDVFDAALDITIPSAGVYRAVPRLPACLRDNYDAAIAQVRTLASAELSMPGGIGRHFADPVQWFYTPMPARAMLGAFDEAGVVYDCMDELSQFRFAHPDLARRERLLMASADIVFAGGWKLCESKSQLHPNVHFFGCGVDAAHFAKARDACTPIPDDVAPFTRAAGRVAGYYGVIDERLDYDLIAQLAESDPALQVVMVGPTAKIDPAALPSYPNLHWLGARPYSLLPNYVRAFDVCLMPFARNESTEYINPTKTLEYMAAGKPVVSTAISDVVRNFSSAVRIARDASEFVRGVRLDAHTPPLERIEAGMELVRASSWEAVVSAISGLMIQAIDSRYVAPASSDHVARVSVEPKERSAKVAVAATPAIA